MVESKMCPLPLHDKKTSSRLKEDVEDQIGFTF